MSKRAIERLGHLLEVERTALLAGDLEAVGALSTEKEALSAGFEKANQHELRAISHALTRNGALLAAAKDGVSTVLATLKQQRVARNSLSSYDSSGKSTTISQASRGTERRF